MQGKYFQHDLPKIKPKKHPATFKATFSREKLLRDQ
jgi:hypothetical protein